MSPMQAVAVEAYNSAREEYDRASTFLAEGSDREAGWFTRSQYRSALAAQIRAYRNLNAAIRRLTTGI